MKTITRKLTIDAKANRSKQFKRYWRYFVAMARAWCLLVIGIITGLALADMKYNISANPNAPLMVIVLAIVALAALADDIMKLD